MKPSVDPDKLIKRIDKIRQGYWNFQEGDLNSSYRTSLEDKFDVSLSVENKEGLHSSDDNDYKLLLIPRYNFKHNCLPIKLSGKDVKNLYNIIEGRYKKYIEKLEKEDDCSIIQTLNELLDKK
jgi:hypothetical protein